MLWARMVAYGRKPTLTGLGTVTIVSTTIYGPCRSRLAWRTLVAKVKDGVLLPAWYAQPNTKVQLTHWPVCSQNLGL
jgi:hypothetical protein